MWLSWPCHSYYVESILPEVVHLIFFYSSPSNMQNHRRRVSYASREVIQSTLAYAMPHAAHVGHLTLVCGPTMGLVQHQLSLRSLVMIAGNIH